MVSQMDTPRPASDRIQVVHCSQFGGPAGPACSGTASACAAARAVPGWPLPVRPLPGRVPRPRPGGRAGLAGGHQSPLDTAVTAGVVQTLAGWLFVILQMAPVT